MLEFPIEIFPKEVKNFILECSEEGGLVKDYLCATALSMLSILMGNNIKLKVSATHTESTMLWIALVTDCSFFKAVLINTSSDL